MEKPIWALIECGPLTKPSEDAVDQTEDLATRLEIEWLVKLAEQRGCSVDELYEARMRSSTLDLKSSASISKRPR